MANELANKVLVFTKSVGTTPTPVHVDATGKELRMHSFKIVSTTTARTLYLCDEKGAADTGIAHSDTAVAGAVLSADAKRAWVQMATVDGATDCVFAVAVE